MGKFASRISGKDEDMELSKRLETLISMAEKGNVVADIGCDHGYVVIRLIKENGAHFDMEPKVIKSPRGIEKTSVRKKS